MRKSEAHHDGAGLANVIAVVLGGFLALGIELVILLLGSVAVSAGVLPSDSAVRITAAACLIGCLVGGIFACLKWSKRRLPAGLLTAVVCYLLILLVALLGNDALELGTTALVELAACLIGGCLAGLLTKGRKKGGKRVKR